MFLRSVLKRTLIVFLVAAMIASMAGCAAKSKEEPVVQQQTEPEENSSVTITDHLGREVTLEKKPERIVSGYYITTSLLIALGLEDKVVGIEMGADKRPIYSLAAPSFLELPNVGSAKNFDLEGCAALEPDLVILPIRLKEAVENLEKLGINVIAVNPEDMKLLKESIDMISTATWTKDEGDKLKAYYDKKMAEMKDIAKSGDKKTIYIAGNSDFLSTATQKMYQNTIIETAGGINAASDIDDTYWATISYEQLIAYNPDVIVVVPAASYTREDIINDERLKAINAVKNDEVYMMPDAYEAWDSPVPSSILGTMWLTSILHGDRYPYDEFVKQSAEFYKEFYDIEINKEDLIK